MNLIIYFLLFSYVERKKHSEGSTDESNHCKKLNIYAIKIQRKNDQLNSKSDQTGHILS